MKQEKNTEISARIAEIIDYTGSTPNNFAKILGYARSQTIYDIINGKSAPSYDFFRRFMISEFSEIINIKWLLTGEGNMLSPLMTKATPEEQTKILDDVSHGVTISHIIEANSLISNLTDNLLSSSINDKASMDKLIKKNTLLERENAKLIEQVGNTEQYFQTIIKQAEEIGQLRERIAQMQQRFEKGAANANTDTIANVG